MNFKNRIYWGDMSCKMGKYNANIQKKQRKKNGEGSIKWTYFEMLDKAYENKASITLSQEILCGSIETDKCLMIENEPPKNTNEISNKEGMIKAGSKQLKEEKKENQLLPWFKRYNEEQNKIQEKIWEEHKELEKQQIKELSEFNSLLRELVNRK